MPSAPRDAAHPGDMPHPNGDGGTVTKRSAAHMEADDEQDYDEFPLEENDEEKILEERRKRRREILAQHAQPLATGDQKQPIPAEKAQPSSQSQQAPPEPDRPTEHDEDFALSKAKPEIKTSEDSDRAPQEPAAAPADESGIQPPAPTKEAPPGSQDGEYYEVEVDDDGDGVDDMFALDEAPKPRKKIRVPKSAVEQGTLRTNFGPELMRGAAGSAVGLHDNWDDPEGYYRVILGEKLGEGRYQVYANLGRGIFSSVVRARDTAQDGRDVAIKIVRRQETMYKAGMREIGVLQRLASLDPDDRKHAVRLFAHFEHRGHLCMVFESLSLNLREIVKRFGKDVGLNLKAVRAYAQQMFMALSLLERAGIMHADIKPDNMLVNEPKTVLKLCDLGSASDVREMEITPYLVSRFYRAPEIILGQAYDCAIDMWSVGCTLYELATGKILFPGRSNNQMLLLMQELKGRFSAKQLKKCQFASQHFEGYNVFLSVEVDRSTGQEHVRRRNLSQPVETLRARLLPGDMAKRMRSDELQATLQLIDLLNRALELDPAKRLTPAEALAHPFFR